MLDMTHVLGPKYYTLTSIICAFLFGLYFNRSCSYGERVAKLRIVGGRDAARGKWPWQALILVKKKNQDSVLTKCGGALIRPDLVVTAAHCVENQVKIVVVFGVWNITNKVEVGRSMHAASRVIRHPCFDGSTKRWYSGSNVALLWLATPTYSTRYLCIHPNSDTDRNNLKLGKSLGGCYATGYGVTETGRDAQILQEVEFSSVSGRSCQTYYGRASANNDILCAYDPRITGKDTCEGDMGGPLVCPTSRENCEGYYLTGVTLAGSTKCGSDRPGIYAAIYPNMDWIKAEMQKEEARRSGMDTPVPMAYSCTSSIVKINVNQEFDTLPANNDLVWVPQ